MTISLVSYCLKPECAKALQSYPTLQSYLLVAHEAPVPTGFSRQEYKNGLPFPTPGDLPDPGIKPKSSALQGSSLPSELPAKPQQEDEKA